MGSVGGSWIDISAQEGVGMWSRRAVICARSRLLFARQRDIGRSRAWPARWAMEGQRWVAAITWGCQVGGLQGELAAGCDATASEFWAKSLLLLADRLTAALELSLPVVGYTTSFRQVEIV
jgi:hypothetical protein